MKGQHAASSGKTIGRQIGKLEENGTIAEGRKEGRYKKERLKEGICIHENVSLLWGKRSGTTRNCVQSDLSSCSAAWGI
jgi:hypothetical protein